MAEVYVDLILKGFRTVQDVPEKLRGTVIDILTVIAESDRVTE